MSAHQPANQPTGQPDDIPTHYVSIRITVGHDQWEYIKTRVFHDCQYVAYAHHGKGGDNPHFHIVVITTDTGVAERLRKRIKSAFPDRTGNGFFSSKFNSNGVLHAITYMSKEGSEPMYSGDECKRWIDLAPEWEEREKNIGGYMNAKRKRDANPDHFWLLTYRNIEKATLRYRQSNGIRSKDLADVLEHMHANGWRLCDSMLKNGLEKSYFEQFEKACNGETIFTAGRFNRMMRSDAMWRQQ